MKAKILGAAVFAIVLPNLAQADTAVLKYSEDWKSDLTVYGFIPFTTSGTSTIAGQSADIDLDLGDVLDILDFGISGRFETWRGDFGFIIDANYLSLGADDTVAIGPANLDLNVDVEQYWVGLLGAFRVASGTNSAGHAYSFDISAGARYNSLKQTFDASGGPGSGISLGGTETWWEPVIGARYVWEINDKWTGAALLDAGGFGVNGSDLQMSASLGASYKVSDTGAIKVGVRYYSLDYSTTRSDGEFAFDAYEVGPFVGYTFSF
ncbi:hypothetical protein [Ruegeria atlantica]|uniref:Outer membrane protein beta-barrel domain-containing protein n=1 Tax=Ruegeria atlantica TaxID=81569 RepID=A0A0P1E2H3_9RHOB|nr:hypothetical protein [Ruegeria atlantica]CUH42623.1 hypothetical protein RUM4293_01511 [Ruegeria atlantica]